jgi:hypothetical protein
VDRIALPDAEFMPEVASFMSDEDGKGWTTLLPWLYSDAGEPELIAPCWLAGTE